MLHARNLTGTIDKFKSFSQVFARTSARFARFPLLLVGLYLLIFGLLIPSLGFYWDDWPSIAVLKLFGAKEFLSFYADERPLQGITYLLFGPLLQVNRVAWQAFTLSLRLLTVLCMHGSLKLVWPRQARVITAAALIFAVYPAFIQQPLAVTYHVLWVQYLLFFVSLGCMALSIRQPRRYWLFTGLGIAAQLLNLLLSEYFYLVELVRPLLLWVLLAERCPQPKQRALKTLQYWSPYLLAFVAQIAGWLIYRATHTFVSYDFGERIGRGNTPYVVIQAFVKAPLATLIKLAQVMVQDSLFILAGTWFRTLDNQGIEWTRMATYLIWGVAGLAGLGSFFILSRIPREAGEDAAPGANSVGSMVLVGGLVVIFGALPAWLTNHQINQLSGGFADRFAAVSQFGASLLIAALGAKLLENWRKLALVASILVGLAAGYQFHVAMDYRTGWKDQRKFYWQTYWRAPYVKPNTLFIGLWTGLPYNVKSSTAFALNSLYPPRPQTQEKSVGYWLYSVEENRHLDNLPFNNGQERFKWAYRHLLFNAERPNTVIIYYRPPQTNCYWFLKPEDTDLPDLPEPVKTALAATALERIERQPPDGHGPPTELLGSEPEPTWCYYFQKADLARQYGDWPQVVQLGQAAEKAGLTIRSHASDAPYEWLPFIEGYARTGAWDHAEAISLAAYQKKPEYRGMLCRLWASLGQDGAVEETQKALGCAEVRP